MAANLKLKDALISCHSFNDVMCYSQPVVPNSKSLQDQGAKVVMMLCFTMWTKRGRRSLADLYIQPICRLGWIMIVNVCTLPHGSHTKPFMFTLSSKLTNTFIQPWTVVSYSVLKVLRCSRSIMNVMQKQRSKYHQDWTSGTLSRTPCPLSWSWILEW